MTNLINHTRPSSRASAWSHEAVATDAARALMVGQRAVAAHVVTGAQPRMATKLFDSGRKVTGYQVRFADGINAGPNIEITNYIGTISAKGAEVATSGRDPLTRIQRVVEVKLGKARGIPPRGRPV